MPANSTVANRVLSSIFNIMVWDVFCQNLSFIYVRLKENHKIQNLTFLQHVCVERAKIMNPARRNFQFRSHSRISFIEILFSHDVRFLYMNAKLCYINYYFKAKLTL